MLVLESGWRGFVAWANRHTIEISVALMIVLFLALVFASKMVVTIPAGSVGVLWYRFSGTDVCGPPLSEGIHAKWPWDLIYVYSTRLTQAQQDIDVLSSDGLKLHLNVAYRYELNPNYAAYVHKLVGPRYGTVLIGSDVAARSRDIVSAHTPQQIYATQRGTIENDIRSAVEAHLQSGFNPGYLIGQASSSPSGSLNPPAPLCATPLPAVAVAPAPNASPPPVKWVQIEAVLIRSIDLPRSVQAAIDSKNRALQLNEEWTYRIQLEQKETQRKGIEAQGIRAIASAVTPGYLRWRGIDATLQLAQSQNSKVVIIGSGQGGLPIILGNMDNGSPVNGAVSSTTAAASRTVADSADPTLQPPLDALLRRALPVSSPAPPPPIAPASRMTATPRRGT